MKLFIDTGDNTKTIVGLDNIRLEKPTGPDKSQQVLVLIDQLLKENHKQIKDITDIVVNIGPGSFTGLRVGITVANTLAWVLKVSVNGKVAVEPHYD
ncbi:MAG: hypothetical protein V1858_03715 [Candidatus Gottesmanbacteria bacterium]